MHEAWLYAAQLPTDNTSLLISPSLYSRRLPQLLPGALPAPGRRMDRLAQRHVGVQLVRDQVTQERAREQLAGRRSLRRVRSQHPRRRRHQLRAILRLVDALVRLVVLMKTSPSARASFLSVSPHTINPSGGSTRRGSPPSAPGCATGWRATTRAWGWGRLFHMLTHPPDGRFFTREPASSLSH